MHSSPACLLDVGNCDPDHEAIRRLVEGRFDVEVDRVMFVEEALGAMRSKRYALVLVNRRIFADGSDGMELHRRARADPTLAEVPVMLVSNFEEAQRASVAAGGVPGFGKAALGESSTIAMLSGYLPARRG